MNNLYNEYLTGTDREVAIIESSFDAEMAKLNMLFTTIESALEVNMIEAEAKVFAENGTYDDLTMLYTEANEEAEKKNGGVLAAVFGAIKRFFTRISNFFKEHFGKQDAIPEQTECDARIEEDMNAFTKCWNTLKSGVSNIKSGNIADGIKQIASVTVPSFLVLGATAAGATITYKKIAKPKLEAMKNQLNQANNEVIEATDKAEKVLNIGDKAVEIFKAISGKSTDQNNKDAKNKGESIFTKAQIVLKDFGSKILGLLQRIEKWISNGVKKITGKENEPEKDENQASEGNGAPAQDTAPQKEEKPKKETPKKKSKGNEKQYITTSSELTEDEEKAAVSKAAAENGGKLSKRKTNKAIKDAQKEKEEKIKASNARVASAVDTWNEQDGFYDTNSESLSIFGVNVSDILMESEVSEDDINELDELFSEI